MNSARARSSRAGRVASSSTEAVIADAAAAPAQGDGDHARPAQAGAAPPLGGKPAGGGMDAQLLAQPARVRVERPWAAWGKQIERVKRRRSAVIMAATPVD